MAGTQLFFDILARDHASATFNKVGAAAAALGKRTDQASKSHQAFGKIVRWTGGMLSAYGIATYLKSSVQEYAKAEAAQNRLGNSYQRFPKMQNATLQSFKDLNKQLMLHTQFDDDDAAAMQANLGRFSLTGKQIQKLTPLVADLAQVQGTDLVTAGSAMGKAFLGNTRALKALGISYTATGNKAKDYRNIVDLINRKVGGESTKANQTAAVKLKTLENQWGELKETVGQAVLPAFNKLAQVAGPAITSLGRAVERNMPQIEQTFQDVWKAASKFGGALKTVWDGFSSMPADVRNVLLALAGGTWAFGKIKGSALGTGISSMFSGLKTITAGNVTVVGKTVTGTPGGPGGKTGLLTAVGGPLGIAAIVATVATVWNARQHANDPRHPVPTGTPGLPGLGNLGSPIKSTGNWISDNQQRSMSAWAARYKGQVNEVRDSIGRVTRTSVDWGNAAKNASLKGQIGAAAFAGSLAKIPKKKSTQIDAEGADAAKGKVKGLGGAIGALRSKRVRVDEEGANASRGRVKGLGGAIGALRSKRVRVDEEGAEQAKAAVDNLRSTMSLLQSKTIDIVTRYRTEGNAPGKQAMVASGGYITGPGSATSDSIPAWLSNGEYVVRAAAVQKYGVDTFHRLNAMGFAKGGEVRKEIRQAKAEASRQRRIAKQAESRGLSDNVLSYLGGMSSKAALKSLDTMSDKALRGAARRASAVPRLQQRRQNARDARRQAAEDAAAAQEDAARAAQEAAEEAARAAEEAAEKERAAQEAVRNAIEETAASYRSFASIATTSADDVTAAQDKLLSSQDAVTEARRKFDLAGNDRDRADAARELAEAEKNLTAAQTARNAVSDKVSAGSIRANMGNKLTRLKDFSAAVKALKAQGLNATTLADILQMGPDQGYEYAKALLDGGLGDINAIQDEITRESADLGLFSAGVNSANATLIGQINAATGGLDVSLVPAPVTLQLNGQAIATALLEYQRQNGG